MKLHALLPKTLFARMLLIILTPMILVQIVTVLIFYERHWDTVTRYMANNLAADIQILLDNFSHDQSSENFATVNQSAKKYFNFRTTWYENGIIAKASTVDPNSYATTEFQKSLKQRISYPFIIDSVSNEDLIIISVQFPRGIFELKANRKRIFSSTSLLVILWTVSTSVLFFSVALIFLRGQVRPIHRLAKAARHLGLGRMAPNYKLEGAREVRLAGKAFQAMRARIQRQMVERTEMLAGVSHDLKTPLTRMKLELEYLPSDANTEGMKKDIADMEAMIESYINFANHAVTEAPEKYAFEEIINDSITSFNVPETRLKFYPPEDKIHLIPIRQRGVRRAIDNLIGNALRYADLCEVRLESTSEQIQIIIDDDGIGIPKEQRISVLRPFVRLSKEDSEGAGLGLSIASDVALSHGGNLLLSDSPLGGLRVRLLFPI